MTSGRRRVAGAQATSVVFVPPLGPTTLPFSTRPGRQLRNVLLLGRAVGGLVAQWQVVRNTVGDRTAAGSHDELLLLEMVEVAADRRRRDIGRGRDLVDLELALTGEWLERRV